MIKKMSKNTPAKLHPTMRWEVFASDRDHWRMGLYRPEARTPADITELEKHSCPELFLCLGGRAGLLILDGVGDTIVEFEPGEALLVTDYHNGFLIEPDAFFMVVERTTFSTEYIDRHTKMSIRSVSVK